MRQAKIYVNDVAAGVLKETTDRRFTFQYYESFLINNGQTAISPAFPKRADPFHSDVLFPYFCNMASEGANRTTQCGTLKIDENDDFGLLLATAGTDTIGAVTVHKL